MWRKNSVLQSQTKLCVVYFRVRHHDDEQVVGALCAECEPSVHLARARDSVTYAASL